MKTYLSLFLWNEISAHFMAVVKKVFYYNNNDQDKKNSEKVGNFDVLIDCWSAFATLKHKLDR